MGVSIFVLVGIYVLILGVFGVVIGLIVVFGNMEDIDMLGYVISVVFVVMFFGIFIGYVLWYLFVNKLKCKLKYEVKVKYMMIEGVFLFLEGEILKVIE